MKYTMEIHVNEYKEISRIIEVTEDILLKDFCEYIIVSLNGHAKYPYQLLLNNGDGPGYISDTRFESADADISMDFMKLQELNLQEKDKLILNYDFYNFNGDWDFFIKVLKIDAGEVKNNFQIIDGIGFGIIEREGAFMVERLLEDVSDKRKLEYINYYLKKYKIDDIKNIDIPSLNEKISDYKEAKRKMLEPKLYEMNAKLVGFEKEIQRKFRVDGSMDLNTFCECVILSFNGDLSHCYTVKRKKEYLEDEFFACDLNYLELEEKQRLTVIYDYGDSWEFKIEIKKIIPFTDEMLDLPVFEVVKGKGYGIIDDCGGIWGLEKIFDGRNEEWGEYDINDFSLEETNSSLEKYLNKLS